MKKIIDEFTDLPIPRQRKWQLRHPEQQREIWKKFQSSPKYKAYKRKWYRERKLVTKQELRALVFWASIAVNGAKDGAYSKRIIDTLVKYSKFLKLRQADFCAIGYESGTLGKELVRRLNKDLGLKIKLRKRGWANESDN